MLERVRASVRRIGRRGDARCRCAPDRDGALNIEMSTEPPNPNQVRGAHFALRERPAIFEAMGIKLVAGRDVHADDRRGGQPVALVNRAFVPALHAGRRSADRRHSPTATRQWIARR